MTTIPDWAEYPHLGERELVRRLDGPSGIVPIGIDVAANRLRWMNLESFHCYEGSFPEISGSFRRTKGEVGTGA